MNWLGKVIQKHVGRTDTILDIGCGIMQATTDILGTPGNRGNLVAQTIVGVDLYPNYLDRIKHRYPTILAGADRTDLFLDKSYDVVLCLDVVEHLPTKEIAFKLLEEMKRIARKKVIAYTPSTFDDNEEHVHEAWGMGENDLQAHHVLITVEDFAKHGFVASHIPPTNNTFAVYTVGH